jgi:hypothetical protein
MGDPEFEAIRGRRTSVAHHAFSARADIYDHWQERQHTEQDERGDRFRRDPTANRSVGCLAEVNEDEGSGNDPDKRPDDESKLIVRTPKRD